LAVIALLTSISLFATCYGLIREEEWSRRIAIKLSFIGIIIALVHIIFYLFVVNDSKNIMIILFSIVIGCSIVSIYFLYRHNVKAYFNRLKTLENESDNKNANSFSLLSSNTITLYLKIFLIAEIVMTFIGAVESLIDINNPEQEGDPVINTIMGISEYLVFAGVTIFPIWWFSRTYRNLKGLEISGLRFSVRRVILSFIIPLLNSY